MILTRSEAILSAIAASLLAYAWGAGEAYPHDAMPTAAQPKGWTYPYSCCSGIDCRAVPDDAVSEGPAGYTIKATGELITYGDTRIKDSPDGQFHWCSVAGANDGRTICLFRAPRGS